MPPAQAQGKPSLRIPAQATGFALLPVCSMHIEGDEKGSSLDLYYKMH